MPRAKPAEPQQPMIDFSTMTADQLIAEHIRLKDYVAEKNKQFNEWLKPTKDKMEAVDSALLAKLNALGGGEKAMLSSDSGTAYISNIMNVSLSEDAQPFVNSETGEQQTGKMAFLDFALANWDQFGNEALLVSAQKDAIKTYMEEHQGLPPPGVKIGWFSRVNVRRS